MDVKRLRYFVAVAELGSFSAAARQLRVAQPAISRHVRLLELDLKKQLLIRNAKGVFLTEHGERLLHLARGITHQLDMLPAIISNPAGEISGRVTFGMPPTISAVLAKPLLQTAAQRYPKAHIHIIESLSGFLLSSIQAGAVDMAILFGEPSHPAYELDVLVREKLFLIGAPSSNLPFDASLEFKHLSNFPLVMKGTTHAVRQLLDATAEQEGVKLQIALEADSLPVVKSVIEDGNAYVISTKTAFRTELAANRLRAVAIIDPLLSRAVSLATSITRSDPQTRQAIRRLAMDITRNLIRAGEWEATATAPAISLH